ncbi:hypothetical protein [Rhizobium sp. NPDC090279]|uniref:hypothetical protein n=1 Tax=Rhizobium sp. NPDC090279 TaxID=3364499 RepID=UPI00383AF5DA
MNAKITFGLATIAILVGYNSLGLDVKYLVYFAILMIAVAVGAWMDSIAEDED